MSSCTYLGSMRQMLLVTLVISMVTFLRLLRLAARASADSLMLLLLVKAATEQEARRVTTQAQCFTDHRAMHHNSLNNILVTLQTQLRDKPAYLSGSQVHCLLA